ncbi:MAG: hypothetical protein PHV93_02580 [Candidatus Pacebacteria bacterium]|nr:hypothetical protein [Candidatus Paceibacterota bacterium]
MFEKQPNEVPFSGLKKTGKKGKYFEIKSVETDPGFVVKEAKTKWGLFETAGVHPLNDIDRAKADLDIMKEDFGEFIPGTSLVVGKNEKGEKTFYAVQEKIEGQALDKVGNNEEVRQQLESFFDKVREAFKKHLFYYKNSRQPQSIFPDMKGWNFIFGTNPKRGETKSRLYFIDTYPVEGADFNDDFINRYIPTIVKPTFPSEYWPVIDDFRMKLAEEIKQHIKAHSDEIPRVN